MIPWTPVYSNRIQTSNFQLCATLGRAGSNAPRTAARSCSAVGPRFSGLHCAPTLCPTVTLLPETASVGQFEDVSARILLFVLPLKDIFLVSLVNWNNTLAVMFFFNTLCMLNTYNIIFFKYLTVVYFCACCILSCGDISDSLAGSIFGRDRLSICVYFRYSCIGDTVSTLGIAKAWINPQNIYYFST